jgi:VWFA-related protein
MSKPETKPPGTVILIGLIAICLSTGLRLRAQPPPGGPEEQDSFTLKIPVNLVLVPVSVRDSLDQPLYGLEKEDFRVFEENVLQRLTYFSSDPLPLSCVLLIDRTLNSQAQSKLEATLLALIESFSAFDELAVFKFDHTPDKLLDFTLDKNKVLEALRNRISWVPLSPGVTSGPFSRKTTLGGIELDNARGTVQPPKTWNTHIHDAMFAAVQALRRRRSRERRKMILVISEGRNAPGNRNSYEDTLEALLRAEIMVYGITPVRSVLTGGAMAKYANATGGEVLSPLKSDRLARAYPIITRSARNQYVLGYIPNTSPERVSFRRFRVYVESNRIRNLKVRSRKGYFAVPSF